MYNFCDASKAKPNFVCYPHVYLFVHLSFPFAGAVCILQITYMFIQIFTKANHLQLLTSKGKNLLCYTEYKLTQGESFSSKKVTLYVGD